MKIKLPKVKNRQKTQKIRRLIKLKKIANHYQLLEALETLGSGNRKNSGLVLRTPSCNG